MIAKLKAWVKDKWGRVVTALGAFGTLLSTALEWAQENAASWVPHVITLTSTKVVAGISLTLLFLASYLRHQKAANVVNALTKPPP